MLTQQYPSVYRREFSACELDLHPKVFPSYASYLEAWLRDAGAAMTTE
jgi:hypothetical protein